MKKITAYVVIRNGSELRLVKARPQLAPNEVAVRLAINAPQPPRVIADVDVTLPEPPPTYVETEVAQYEDEDEAQA